ncbi:MAG: GC-type dockerin domain-anchored protein, partial [Flavobacteriales bacterium]
PGGGTWRAFSDTGEEVFFTIPSGSSPITLNWQNINTFTVVLDDPGTGNPNNTFNFDDVVYSITTFVSPETPSVAVVGSDFCPGDDVTVNVTGALNDGIWKVTEGCGSTEVGLFPSNTIILNPTETTTYAIQGIIESGCGPSSNCVTFTVEVLEESTPFIDFTIDPEGPVICSNEMVTATCAGGEDGAGAITRWYTEPNGGGVLFAEGNPVILTISETVTYHVRREGTCNSSESFPVTVTFVPDVTPPAIACPFDIEVTNTIWPCEPMAIDIGTANASDACGFTLSNDAPALFPVGVTTVVWEATDIGATSTCNQMVTVNCCIGGCLDMEACNYNPSATCDDGGCEFESCIPCPGDFNSDGIINAADLLQFLGSFGSDCGDPCPADLNEDLVINASDLLVFLGLFGTNCP